ncbi:Major facilitator family transporter [Pseudomonas ficuserectae]|nr:Major facilitator family transporter [Pseudomonas ficuserectae]
MTTTDEKGAVFETDLPARLDRLPWGRFHTLLVVALGITWLLDGLEVTLAGSVAGALKASPALNLTNSDVGLAGAAYIAGAVLGALFFGWLADRLGRRKLFFITLLLYVGATAATAFSFSVWSFMLFRFLTGMGIGGEYTAINSTIQEFTPARYRGWVDLTINGTFWLGAALGAIGSIVLLDPQWVGAELGWRLCFGIGAVLGLLVLLMRLWLPESPRWLLIHGQATQAKKIVEQIRGRFAAPGPCAVSRAGQTLAPARARPHAAGGGCQNLAGDVSPAIAGWPDAADGAGFFLQCDFLHLRTGIDRLLWRAVRARRLVCVAAGAG